VIIYAAELAVAAIILFYVVEMLTMPVNMKRAGMCFCCRVERASYFWLARVGAKSARCPLLPQ